MNAKGGNPLEKRAFKNLFRLRGRRGQDIQHARRRQGSQGAWPRRRHWLRRTARSGADARAHGRTGSAAQTTIPGKRRGRRGVRFGWGAGARSRLDSCRRNGAHQRLFKPPPQTVQRHRGAAQRRHRRVHDRQRAASGKPERHDRRHHDRARTRAHPRFEL